MRGLFACALILFMHTTKAQTTEATEQGDAQPSFHDVSGSAYLIRDWTAGVIKFSSGRTTNQFKLKFDCIANRVLLQFNGSSYATESKIREFVIYPKGFSSQDSMVFRKSFPAIDMANEETYYQVLLDDSAVLLKLHLKLVSEERQLVSKIVYRRIRDDLKYFLLLNGKMAELPADKSAIPNLFGDKASLIKEFIETKQLKFRSQQDFIDLLKFFNSL